jgi:hypothetical protein
MGRIKMNLDMREEERMQHEGAMRARPLIKCVGLLLIAIVLMEFITTI